MNEWMPWEDSDPQMVMNYFGPPEGPGAGAKWESEGSMGHGQSKIVESTQDQNVKYELTYLQPMEMSQGADITLTKQNEGTIVRWSVNGHNNFIGRFVCIFMNMDKMVGAEFEKGLAKLKSLVEGKS